MSKLSLLLPLLLPVTEGLGSDLYLTISQMFLGFSQTESRGYIPGTRGGAWTDDEVLIVKEKILVMTNPENAKALYSDVNRFPPIVNLVFGNVWHPEDPSNKHWFNKTFPRTHPELAPTTRKLVRLAFHDCLKNKDEDGNRFGGCDGCLNWENMDWMNEVPLGNMAHTSPVWPSFRAEPVSFTTDNNKLSTTVYALEWIYVDPSWPPGTPELPESLWSTGKSRADLWQLAANTALEIEMARANYGCSHKVSFQQMVAALEGKENCLWKLEKPVPFQYGRVDCVRNEEEAKTKFPFEATNSESHPNSFGQANTVLEDLKEDFGMTARQSIALMAAHGIATHSHNKVLGIEYRWAGSPFISNLYFKTLASKPQYNLGAGLSVNDNGQGVLAGDKFGRPLNRDIQGEFCLHTNDWWNTSLPDSGPFFFRPMTTNAPGSYDEDLRPRHPCFKWNHTTEVYDRDAEVPACLSDDVTIDEETGVQYGGPAISHYQSWAFTFYLPYEMNFVKEFSVDSENHPRGCNFPDVYPEWGTDAATAIGRSDHHHQHHRHYHHHHHHQRYGRRMRRLPSAGFRSTARGAISSLKARLKPRRRLWTSSRKVTNLGQESSWTAGRLVFTSMVPVLPVLKYS